MSRLESQEGAWGRVEEIVSCHSLISCLGWILFKDVGRKFFFATFIGKKMVSETLKTPWIDWPTDLQPTNQPTDRQTNLPTNQPTNQPNYLPTNQPTYQPTDRPINQPAEPFSSPSRQEKGCSKENILILYLFSFTLFMTHWVVTAFQPWHASAGMSLHISQLHSPGY